MMNAKAIRDNIMLHPVRMDIALKAFVHIVDTLQAQKEGRDQPGPPSIPIAGGFLTPPPSSEALSVYLSAQLAAMNRRTASLIKTASSANQEACGGCEQPSQVRVMLTDTLAREIGVYKYFEPVRRAFQV